MPRIIDEDQGLKHRFENLQKLLSAIDNVSEKVTWRKNEIKEKNKYRSFKSLRNI